MTPADFDRSLADPTPPNGLPPALAALWWAGKGDWDKAHDLVMNENGRDAAWVHAYLHRLEGDLDNARYWYGRARRPEATGPLAEEWQTIAATLLGTPEDNSI